MTKKPSSPGGTERSAKEPTFEESLVQLETIIERIEGGKVGLEGAIAEYERGVGLLRRLRDTLRKTEQRIGELDAELAALDSDSAGAPGHPHGAEESERSSW